jgi:hypothetical protein
LIDQESSPSTIETGNSEHPIQASADSQVPPILGSPATGEQLYQSTVISQTASDLGRVTQTATLSEGLSDRLEDPRTHFFLESPISIGESSSPPKVLSQDSVPVSAAKEPTQNSDSEVDAEELQFQTQVPFPLSNAKLGIPNISDAIDNNS